MQKLTTWLAGVSAGLLLVGGGVTLAGQPALPPAQASQKIVFTRPLPPLNGPPIDTNIWSMAADGSQLTQLTTATSMERAPSISPDGTKIVYQSYITNTWTLWVMNADGSNAASLPIAGLPLGGPEWSPDGTQIAYSNDVVSFWEIWVANADGSNPHRVSDHAEAAGHPSWSPDGQKIVYHTAPATNYFDVYVVNSNGLSQTLLSSASGSGYSHQVPAWSPDGTKIATLRWAAGGTGPYDLWVMNADGSGGQVVAQNLDNFNQQEITWSTDSQWLLFGKGGEVWRVRRNGQNLTQMTFAGGAEPSTNVIRFPPPYMWFFNWIVN